MPFTVVFDGDVEAFEDNPFDFKSDFGMVIGIAKGDLIAEKEKRNERITEAFRIATASLKE